MDDADERPLIVPQSLKRRLRRWLPQPQLFARSRRDRPDPCHIYAMRLDRGAGVAGSLVRLSPEGGDFAQATMHPFGRHVAFWGQHPEVAGRQIWIADIEQHSCRPITQGPHLHGHPAWWPDGGSLAGFVRTTPEDWRPEAQFEVDRPASNLVRLHLDGSEPDPLTDGPFVDERPTVTPDGKTVIFVSNRATTGLNLWALDIERGDLRQLTERSPLDYRPVVAPDGRKIVFFTATGQGAHSLALITWPEARPLTLSLQQSFAWMHGPWWSADSRHLLAHALTKGDTRPALWLLDSEEGGCTRLTLPGVWDSSHGTWDREERWLTFDSRQRLDVSAAVMREERLAELS